MVRSPKYYPNKKPGPCGRCGQTVPAGHGRVRRDRYGNWYVSHHPTRQVGWPDARLEGGCPPPPEKDTEPVTETAAANARDQLYRRYFRDGEPPRYRDPGTDQGRDRMNADVQRLLAMTAQQLYSNHDALATLLDIGDHQGWT